MPAAAKIDLSALPEDQRDAVAELLRENGALKEINARLEHLVAELNHAVHGKKSEKLSEDDRQLAFEDLEIGIAEAEEQKQTKAPGDDKPRRKRITRSNRGNLPAGLPRIEQVVEPDSLMCPCGCGQMHRIGEDRNERLDIVPAKLRVIVTVRPKYACRACTDGVSQAPAPAWLIAGGLPTEGAIAHVPPLGDARHRLPVGGSANTRATFRFYAIEKDIRGTSPGQRLSARQARSAPLVEAFGTWLHAQRLRVSAKSRLGEKLTYIHRHWDGLQTFLTDGRVEIDSNSVENLVRPIALNRKNALFAGHDEGGRAWGRIASLIETAKVNGVEPLACLKSTLEAIAAGHPQSRIDDLLPWNFQPSS